MLHQRRSKVFFAAFMLGLLILNSVGCGAPVTTLAPFSTTIPTVTGTTTSTDIPALPVDVEPQAWLDGTIDSRQFSPKGSLVIHFNIPMDERSSLAPMLSWPSLDGNSSWDSSRTILTFSPSKTLNNNSVYTFFLDPALRSANGKVLEDSPEWQILTRSGPEIVRVFPPAGDLDRRYGEINITFDQEMVTSLDGEMISIEPMVPAKLNWKTPYVLQIKLEKPFEFGQRYKLTLGKGLSTAQGSTLEEDYVWSYQQLPVRAQLESIDDDKVKITFNYSLSRLQTTRKFSVSPSLQGEWIWDSDRQIVFKSSIPIPAGKLYSVGYPTLVDGNGFEVVAPSVQFSGIPPVNLLADTDYKTNKYHIQKNVYSGYVYYYTDSDLDAIQLEFLVPVDHASAEKAFSLTPSVPGTFRWEKCSQNRDILVYKIGQLLQPSTDYVVQLNPTVLDTQGQSVIALPFTRRVRVSEFNYTVPAFGAEGNNIQVLDAQGPRRLQYAPGKQQATFLPIDST